MLRNDRRNLIVLALQAPLLALLLATLLHPNNFRPPCIAHLVAGCIELKGTPGLAAGIAVIDEPNQNARKALQFSFMLAAIAVWLGTLNSVREIAREAAIYRRERLSNLKVLPYVGSKLAVLIGVGALQVLSVGNRGVADPALRR